MAFIMDAVTVCTTRANMLYVLSFFLLINRTKLTIIFERPILEQAVNVRVHASFDSCYDHRGSRFMIIKRHRLSLSLSLSFFSLVFSLAADSFLKTNFDFPIRGRDLRPPVSPRRLFCALSRPLSSLHARDSFFFSGPAKEARAFLLPLHMPYEEDSLTESLSCAKWIHVRENAYDAHSLTDSRIRLLTEEP